MSSEQLPEQPALPPGIRTALYCTLLDNKHGQQVADYMLHLKLPRQMGVISPHHSGGGARIDKESDLTLRCQSQKKGIK